MLAAAAGDRERVVVHLQPVRRAPSSAAIRRATSGVPSVEPLSTSTTRRDRAQQRRERPGQRAGLVLDAHDAGEARLERRRRPTPSGRRSRPPPRRWRASGSARARPGARSPPPAAPRPPARAAPRRWASRCSCPRRACCVDRGAQQREHAARRAASHRRRRPARRRRRPAARSRRPRSRRAWRAREHRGGRRVVGVRRRSSAGCGSRGPAPAGQRSAGDVRAQRASVSPSRSTRPTWSSGSWRDEVVLDGPVHVLAPRPRPSAATKRRKSSTRSAGRSGTRGNHGASPNASTKRGSRSSSLDCQPDHRRVAGSRTSEKRSQPSSRRIRSRSSPA